MSAGLGERLASPDPAERRAACRDALAEPEPGCHLEALVARLSDPDASVARAAADSLVALARRVKEVRLALRGALRGDDPARRVQAAFTLARLDAPGTELLPALVEGLARPEGAVRWAAARLLVDTGRLRGEVLPLLLERVRHADAPAVRRMATFCLRELAPDRPEAARELVAATHDPELAVRRAAFTALAGLLDPPGEVVARLGEALDGDPDPATRLLAAAALGELAAAGPEATSRACRAALETACARSQDAALGEAIERALARLSGTEPA